MRQIASLSKDISKQIALLINRKGYVEYVIIGTHDRIMIPDLAQYRMGHGRLRGLRCVHTHLGGEPISEEDLTDMFSVRLDIMVVVQVGNDGIPGEITYAYVLPKGENKPKWAIETVSDIGQLRVNAEELIYSIEDELGRGSEGTAVHDGHKAILVGITDGSKHSQNFSMDELEELSISDDLIVTEKIVKRVNREDPRFFLPRGGLMELAIAAVQTNCDYIVFDTELSPTQVKNLTDFTELRIIDRTQLILDIFSRRAVSKEGKIQVELAQLKYLLPRLGTMNTAMSRLTGGIGGRGPGETKLEINRRRANDRITKLKRELKEISKQREYRRFHRRRNELPVISIVGYTNAGKSTLLNSLTDSSVNTKNRMFETLDPTTRRLRFPKEYEAVITDTVGFIRNLPPELLDAFASTLEELRDADIILHVVDGASPYMEEHIKVVNDLLEKLSLNLIPEVMVINKRDLMEKDAADELAKRMGGIAISAIDPPTLNSLIEKIEHIIEKTAVN